MLLYPDTEQRLYLCRIVFYRVTLLFLVWRHFKNSPIRPFSCSLPAVKTQVQEPLIRNKIIQCQKTRMSRWLGAIFTRCWNKDVGTRFSPYPKKGCNISLFEEKWFYLLVQKQSNLSVCQDVVGRRLWKSEIQWYFFVFTQNTKFDENLQCKTTLLLEKNL